MPMSRKIRKTQAYKAVVIHKLCANAAAGAVRRNMSW